MSIPNSQNFIKCRVLLLPNSLRSLDNLFVSYGMPEQLVSGNGPQFVAEEFDYIPQRIMCSTSRVIHAILPLMDNELAERLAQTFKEAMKAGEKDGLTLQHKLDNLLLLPNW